VKLSVDNALWQSANPNAEGIADRGFEQKALRFPRLRRVAYFALAVPLLTAVLEQHLTVISRNKTREAEQSCSQHTNISNVPAWSQFLLGLYAVRVYGGRRKAPV